MHKLMLDKSEYSSANVRNDIQLPCGPIFKCKKHARSRCDECLLQNHYYDEQVWRMKWKCNKHISTRFRVLDSKNGLHMTLMKTVKDSHRFIY